LSATDGRQVWAYLARAAIWGSSPVVEGRVIFGDKAGWVYALSAEDGKLISEIQVGENIDATPAVMNGRIYVGAFNGKFYCLK
jgi:outer membrane protein assembly factor BamB